jgi:hypothetical protein
MKSGRVLIAAVFFLGTGLWVLFEYCNGVPAGRNWAAADGDCVHRRNRGTVPATARGGAQGDLGATQGAV